MCMWCLSIKLIYCHHTYGKDISTFAHSDDLFYCLQALKDKKLLAWEEQLKKEGLLDWLQGQCSISHALDFLELPACMHEEVKEYFAAQEAALLNL